MAGASRIVSALDAGPAGVIPPAQRGPSSHRRAWYRFALTPVRMSIAATIVVAVGVTFTARRVADNSLVRAKMAVSPINAGKPTVAASPSADSSSVTVVDRTVGQTEGAGEDAVADRAGECRHVLLEAGRVACRTGERRGRRWNRKPRRRTSAR